MHAAVAAALRTGDSVGQGEITLRLRVALQKTAAGAAQRRNLDRFLAVEEDADPDAFLHRAFEPTADAARSVGVVDHHAFDHRASAFRTLSRSCHLSLLEKIWRSQARATSLATDP